MHNTLLKMLVLFNNYFFKFFIGFPIIKFFQNFAEHINDLNALVN